MVHKSKERGDVTENGHAHAGALSRWGVVAGWLGRRLRGAQQPRPRLAVIERIALAPKQSLVLVEAEGKRLLVSTSAEAGASFYSLDPAPRQPLRARARMAARPQSAARVSW